MKKTLITVGVFAVIIAAVVVGVLLGGGANAQFVGLRCDVDKPEGEYDKCDAVADFDDLMPVKYGAYTFADGSVVDRWAVDAEYYGRKDYTPLSGEGRTTDVYALETGEVLLEVRIGHYFHKPDSLSDAAFSKGIQYCDTHLPCDLVGQLNKAYLEFGRAKADSMPFAFKTIEFDIELDVDIYLFARETKTWQAHVRVREYYLQPDRGLRGNIADGEPRPTSGAVYLTQIADSRKNLKELGRYRFTFDSATGEFLSIDGPYSYR